MRFNPRVGSRLLAICCTKATGLFQNIDLELLAHRLGIARMCILSAFDSAQPPLRHPTPRSELRA